MKFDGECLKYISNKNKMNVFMAIKQGIGRLYNDSLEFASFVRVTRQDYIGRSIYRHLEEVE